MLPYLYSTGWETTISGVPMMRAMVLEYPDDLSARNLDTQYMLGKSLLVAPVFDQQKHHIYLPEGSWVDFETGKRYSGSRWITYPKDIEVIPMFLRENRCLPMLKTPPRHIADENFADLQLVMNIRDNLDQLYYDDGVEGHIRASLENGTLTITLTDVPAESFKIYTVEEISSVIINGNDKPFQKEQGCCLVL
jgi:alpha-glucosidase (family GH31 glycosyl hydrolase)